MTERLSDWWRNATVKRCHQSNSTIKQIACNVQFLPLSEDTKARPELCRRDGPVWTALGQSGVRTRPFSPTLPVIDNRALFRMASVKGFLCSVYSFMVDSSRKAYFPLDLRTRATPSAVVLGSKTNSPQTGRKSIPGMTDYRRKYDITDQELPFHPEMRKGALDTTGTVMLSPALMAVVLSLPTSPALVLPVMDTMLPIPGSWRQQYPLLQCQHYDQGRQQSVE
ncbi:hypothetical protein JZ751_022682 [Albula glossodonta]|uniref:Uncharacterized protein n=1 Tax=Albula glossodonta TaxID=121402 RepID=A0A8T2PM93_9TELE|nr:hypothetical protein JZ751_022682 [Albula glossodonta]